MTASFAVSFPYRNQIEELDPSWIICRWISPDPRFWKSETNEPTSNLWNPIGDTTAKRLGFERAAVSIYFQHAIHHPETVESIADHQVGEQSGIAFLTIAQVAEVQGLGILYDGHTHPAHGILFRVGQNPKLSGAQRNRLNVIVKENDQIYRFPRLS